MANGQQQKEENIESFRIWTAQNTDDDFREIVRGGQLSRTEIVKQCNIGRSSLLQNPVIKAELAQLEQELRDRGVLPAIVGGAAPQSPSASSVKSDLDRIRRLEVENAQLKEKVWQYENHLKKYRLLESCLSETMRIPR